MSSHTIPRKPVASKACLVPPHESIFARNAEKELPALPRPASPTTTLCSSTSARSFSWSLKRSSSSGSKAPSFRSSSRRGSLAESIKEKAGILLMDEEKRDKFVFYKKQKHDRELEEHRQDNPEARSNAQKAFLDQQAQDMNEFERCDAQANLEHAKSEKTLAKQLHQEACQTAALEGRPRPTTPPRAKSDAYRVRLDSLTRQQIGDVKDPDAFELSFALSITLRVSKWGDKFRTPRKSSDASDATFKITDEAPPGMMSRCGQSAGPYQGRGCDKPCTSSLKEGLCKNCRDMLSVETNLSHRWKGHAPKSPPEDARHGELYMKLAGRKKLRKVRNTIYQDPGNPFATEDPATLPDQIGSSFPLDVSNYKDADYWKMQADLRYQDIASNVDDSCSDTSEPFDLASTRDADTISKVSRHSPQSIPFVYSNTPQHAKAMVPGYGDRRSTSVDIAFLPSWTDPMVDTDEIYELAPRGWRSDSLPSLHIQTSSEVTLKVNKTDTDFYAFYDDLLAEYGIGISYW